MASLSDEQWKTVEAAFVEAARADNAAERKRLYSNAQTTFYDLRGQPAASVDLPLTFLDYSSTFSDEGNSYSREQRVENAKGLVEALKVCAKLDRTPLPAIEPSRASKGQRDWRDAAKPRHPAQAGIRIWDSSSR